MEDRSICAACGGYCCKRVPGAALPGDFGDGKEMIEARVSTALATGYWAIDWWDGDPREGETEMGRAFFLRPSTKEDAHRRIFRGLWPSEGGGCVFLRSNGCSLEHDQRPFTCRELVPVEGGRGCYSSDEMLKRPGGENSKRVCTLEWLPYQQLLERVGREVEDGYRDKEDAVCATA